nr:hypothetical protein [uncultured bacterium]
MSRATSAARSAIVVGVADGVQAVLPAERGAGA